ncbi:hypothetical protein IEN91_05270 [Bacillus velezensis]|uniref:hypothetical protein n=1 Tax=Bacillus velezensis TaxID=492670 RepID=UPI0018C53615|nr:hypothetical protein [Bacillus velezensis]QPK89849.1 hypothetical protein IEN91_05270 [Bacillus velezensis]
MQDMKYVELIFENCESMIIPIDRVAKLEFGSLRESFQKDKYTTDYVSLDITYNKDEIFFFYHIREEPLGFGSSNNIEDRPNILGRILSYYDICVVNILNGNEEKIQSVYTPWDENDEYNNRYMKTKVEKGLLKITIKEGEVFEHQY